MPYRCCETGCKGNYPTGLKVQVFSFPKEEKLLEKWKQATPRENLTISKTTKVCEQHFHPHEIVTTSQDIRRNGDVPRTLARPSFLSTAVPSVFSDCPHYLSKPSSYRIGPEVKRQKLEGQNIQAAVQDSLKEREIYLKAQSIASLCELKAKLSMLKLSDFWSIITKPTSVLFANIETVPSVIKYSVLVSEGLDVSVFVLNEQRNKIGLNGDKVLTRVSSIVELRNLLDFVEKPDMQINVPNNIEQILSYVYDILQTLNLSEYEKSKNIHFIIEQLKLLSSKKISYTPSFMILSCLSYSISPCAYRSNRDYGFFVGPHPSTIQRVCSNINIGPQKSNVKIIFYHIQEVNLNFLNHMNIMSTF
ncbi:uncharacterized protein LOC124798504 [Schistocerca piceifrons]|uniref:uncharacterized protein LOC124798504 n=1 Tax=Schistocerca piceifrons TaxID=274613 RepID=UPI001F5E4B92|nr:uncharacterized protein LOC124798504 [Schistocerca piceifrons]